LARAVQTVKMLKELSRKELTVGVILTLTKENEKEIEKIYYFIRDTLKPDLISPLLIRGQVRVPETKNIAYEQYKKLIAIWTKDIKLRKLKGYPNSIIGSLVTARDIAIRRSILSGIRGNFIQGNCMAGILGTVIYENGEVFPCEILSDKIGNIRDYDYDFKKIWFSKRRVDIIKKINREKCWCTHECFQGLNVVSNTKGMLSVFKELKCILPAWA
jgi:radical SAM protein with 4Fe4S-binding SPASM domain